MNNQPPKVLYETVGKLAGINVLFDPQMQPGRNANLDLSNVTLDEALDYVALLTKTFWKPISANAIFVTEDNVTKRRDYEDEVVKVFYLKNPTSVQEFQEIITGIRSVTDVRRMFTFNAQNAVMVRDTVDKVALVEKLLHDMDKPKAEVVVDVIVMDVASDRSRSIAAGLGFGQYHRIGPAYYIFAANHDQHQQQQHDRDHRDHSDHDHQRRTDSGATGAHLDVRLVDHVAGSPAAGGDVRFEHESDAVAAGAGFGRTEGDAENRRKIPVRNRQFSAGCRHGRGKPAGEHAVSVRGHGRKRGNDAARSRNR